MTSFLLYVCIACAAILLMALTGGLIVAVSILANDLIERLTDRD